MRETLSGITASTLALVRTRLELLGLEAQGAGQQWLARAFWLLLAACCFLLALLLASLLLVALAWPTPYRLWVLGALALFYLLLGLGLVAWLARRIGQDPNPFAVTLSVLAADWAALARQPAEPDQAASPVADDPPAGGAP